MHTWVARTSFDPRSECTPGEKSNQGANAHLGSTHIQKANAHLVTSLTREHMHTCNQQCVFFHLYPSIAATSWSYCASDSTSSRAYFRGFSDMCSSRAPASSGMSQPAKHHFLIRHRASSDVIDPFANDKLLLHLPPNLCNVQVAVQALGTPFGQATASIKGPHCCCRASTNASILPLTWIGCGAAL